MKEYFDTNRSQWNEQKLRDVIIDEDVDQIFLLKISSTAHQDLMGWHYNEDGIYTVKFGYWLGTHLPTNVPPTPTYGSAELKYKIWKTSAPAKLKHFLWRLLSKSLATSNNLKRRHIGRVDQCKRCCSAAETEEHIFFECPYAKKIWRASGVSNRIINDQSSTLEEKIEACLQCSLLTRLVHFQDLPFWLLWRLWKSGNTLIFQQKEIHWRSLLRYANEDLKEWKQIESTEVRVQPHQSYLALVPVTLHWQRPPMGWFKCNTDGSFRNIQTKSTAGWVIRDANGTYKGSAHARGRRCKDAPGM